MPKRLGVVFNPVAGKGHAARFEQKILSTIRKNHPEFIFARTQFSGHAFQLAQQIAPQVDILIAAGGDGTVNEVVAALTGTERPLGIVPLGSGNDFIRVIGISRNPFEALTIAIDGTMKQYDLGNVTIIEESSSERITKLFLNTCGIGLDGDVAKEMQAINHLHGLWLYGIAAINALRRFKPFEIKLQSPVRSDHFNALLVCVGNGQYEGSGFKLTPHARPDDGLFQICTVADMPLRRILKALIKLQFEKHGTVDGVQLFDSDNISIQSCRPVTVHADGEVLSVKARQIDISIQPKKVWIQSPFLKITSKGNEYE